MCFTTHSLLILRLTFSRQLDSCQCLNQRCGSRSGGSSPFSVEAEAEAPKFYRFRFHIEGKNGGRKEIGSAILWRGANRGSINIKK